MNNTLDLKTINELNQYSFHIPSYQRGYKWTCNEVTDLLNDINDFKQRLVKEGTEDRTWYCLQPIVVKVLDDKISKFEVIDGQQRLTTIYLILHFINQDYIESRRTKLFDLDYETRSGTEYFLKNLDENIIDDSNADFFHISKAYQTIAKWFNDRDINFDKQQFISKFNIHSKVIWYESKEENPISIFTRINIGKIPLTNSELIKALFLNSSNFSDIKKDELRLKQLEIASEWDNIEHTFQDNRFWYFLTSSNVETNRIEFIFNLMNEEEDTNDPYSTFRFFNNRFKNCTKQTIEEYWKLVKIYFQRFEEWYNQRTWYHKIGFLVSIGATSVKELVMKSSEFSKSDFENLLDDMISSSMSNISLDNLQYSDKNDVRKTLLLYNILTMIKSSNDNSYFPFDLYKNGNWDIEHITSIKESIPDKNKKDWLKDAKIFIDTSEECGKELLSRAETCDINNEAEFKKLFEKIVSHFNSELKDDEINDISNLTLLDSETNRGYKNAVFPLKRKTIIERDKAGVFIPICTKNLFLKYFSEYPPKISFWTQEDREMYENDLFIILKKYLN